MSQGSHVLRFRYEGFITHFHSSSMEVILSFNEHHHEKLNVYLFKTSGNVLRTDVVAGRENLFIVPWCLISVFSDD